MYTVRCQLQSKCRKLAGLKPGEMTPGCDPLIIAASSPISTPVAERARGAISMLRIIESEGLMLCTSKTGGYYGVRLDSPGRPKPYQARVRRGGRNLGLGYFATAEEAALCIARSPEGRAVAAERAAVAPPLTSEEARQQAQAEGLTLVVSESSTAGYLCVHLAKPGKLKPFKAQVSRGGKIASLGYFATADEAALYVARAAAKRAASTAPQKKSAKGSTKPCPAMPASRANLKEACPAQLMPPGAFVNEEEMVPPMPPGASRWDGLLLLEERARRACFLLACAGGQEEERSNSRPKRHGSE